ncbi:hypothetical protein FRX31_009187 [Thalictrum thalictroides]|uniref:Uncharacterized protein n=1 Tax=Thalictrum thalictroides TaxID=46969 RepID=A0A7J6WYN9_THATH|nr:hypothetical protein FRX31_009187 [Thalictrum thalictroides]
MHASYDHNGEYLPKPPAQSNQIQFLPFFECPHYLLFNPEHLHSFRHTMNQLLPNHNHTTTSKQKTSLVIFVIPVQPNSIGKPVQELLKAVDDIITLKDIWFVTQKIVSSPLTMATWETLRMSQAMNLSAESSIRNEKIACPTAGLMPWQIACFLQFFMM